MKRGLQQFLRRKKMEKSMLIRLELRKVVTANLKDALENDWILNICHFQKKEGTLDLFFKIIDPEEHYKTYCEAIAEYLAQKFQLQVKLNNFDLVLPCVLHNCTCPNLSSLRVVDTYNLLDYLPPFFDIIDPEELIAF